MLFRRPLTQISPQNFIPDSQAKSLQLRLSTGFVSIVEKVKQSERLIFQVYGEPGCGCSTLVQGIFKRLCETNHIKKKEILYLSLNRYCNEKSLWDFLSELAKETNDKQYATFFSSTSVKKDDKIRTFLELFSFKLVCFDNADCSGNIVESFLEHLVSSKTKTFITTKANQIQINGEVSMIEVNGINLSTAQDMFTKLGPSRTYDERKIACLCEILKYNPVAIRLYCAFVNSHDLDECVKDILQDATAVQQHSNDGSKFALDLALDYVSQYLGVSSISILHQLCHLRQPLPVTEVKPEVRRLVDLTLLTVKTEGSVSFVSIDPCLQKHLSCRKGTSTKRETGAHFSVLECWLSLVSDKLQRLVQDAEENAWPFVPEKWQYLQIVGKEENYNIKDLLTSRNVYVHSLTELQILQECLYHAYIEDNFEKMAALVLVLDRFLYWQGEGKIAMDVVDYIQSTSPQTAIAPQLVIRRVRFMKSDGSLQEAEETLDKLLQAKSKIGQWKYRKKEDFHLVSGVSVQIKGEIQYRLGHWSTGASLLIQSVRYFGSLPRPDKKGLASSYGLLCQCFRNMTITDYAVLAQSFGLFQCHPLLAAYFSAQEAAKMSVYAPMFFLRAICQAGEVLLEFLNHIQDKNEEQHLLRIVIEDLKDSIQAHQSYASLTSREQFYLLTCAVYKISLALFQIGSKNDKEKGTKLKELSTELYEHYCTSNDRVLINKDVVAMVDQCLHLLGLDAFSQDNLTNAGEVLVNYFEKRKVVRQRENTSLTAVGFFDNLVKHGEASVLTVSTGKQDKRIYDRCMGLHGTADRCVGTAEVEKDKGLVHQDEALGGTADRCTGTAEVEDELAHQDKALDRTVNRSMGTAEVEEDQLAHQDEALDGAVDRSMGTAEVEEDELAHQDGAQDGTVDRCMGTAEVEEDELAHQDQALDGAVDRCLGTAEVEEDELAHQDEALDGAVNRSVGTAEVEEDQLAHQDEALGGTVDRCVGMAEVEEDQLAHQDGAQDGTVDRCVGTEEVEDKLAHQDGAQDGAVDRCMGTAEEEEEDELVQQDEAQDGTVNRSMGTAEIQDEPQAHQRLPEFTQHLLSRTEDHRAQTSMKAMEGVQGIVLQSLVDEAASLASTTMEIKDMTDSLTKKKTTNMIVKRVKDAILWKYDYPTSQWRGQPTMVYIGEQMKFAKGKEGGQRDVYAVEFINQDEQLGRYVAKCYRKDKTVQQYQNDILSQMTAKQFVAWFNQRLYEAGKGVPTGNIQFLPVFLLELINSNGQTGIFNAEPYMSGEFTKLTNNTDWKNIDQSTDLVLAYSHFTYQASDGKLIIVDIQGWAPRDKKGCTFLTDPQIHSHVYKCFGTGNFGKKGYDNFWRMQHSECNDICKMLGLKRPSNK